MSILFTVLAAIFLLTGLIGTVVPVLPGPPIAWAGLLLSYFTLETKITVLMLILTGAAAIFVTFLDNIFPSLMTKRAGGSKAGVIGCTIGTIIGFFLGPVLLLLAPFTGAFIGELIHDSSDVKRAWHAAKNAFFGYMLGIGIKIITVNVFIWIFVWAVIL